jgi:hypothetical protein
MTYNVLKCLIGVILLSPGWIWMISTKTWRPLTKKVLISILAIISVGVAIFGFLRPQHAGTSSLSWLGFVALALYPIASVISAYFNWPRERKETVKSLVGNPNGRPTRKNITYVSIPLMTGSDGDTSVTFLNATFRKINESKKRYPDPDFGAWLIEQIYHVKKIMAERRGIFRKKSFCSSCGTELNAELRLLMQIDYELKYKDFDPFSLHITIPSVACPQCNKLSGIDLDGSLVYHLNEALIAAFKSENIKP